MSATTQYTDFSDLYTGLENAVREATGVTATENQAKRYINVALQDMHLGFSEKFPWAEREAVLITQPRYTEGTVAANRGSTTLTGTGTLWNTTNELGVANARAGGKVVIGDSYEVFEVSSVSSDTSITLTSNYVGGTTTGSITAFADPGGGQVTVTSAAHGLSDSMKVTITGTTSYDGTYTITNTDTDTYEITATFVADDATGTWSSGSVSGESYVYYEDEYALASDFLRPVDQRRFSGGPTPITLIGRSEFRRQIPRNFVPGSPTVATIVDRAPSGNTTPRRRIILSPSPSDSQYIRYSYITNLLAVSSAGAGQTSLSADADEPIVPLRYRHAILFHALYHWYRDKKDDVRSQEAKAEYTDIMLRIAADNDIGSNHARFSPRIQHYRRQASRPYRNGNNRFDHNGKFDRFEI